MAKHPSTASPYRMGPWTFACLMYVMRDYEKGPLRISFKGDAAVAAGDFDVPSFFKELSQDEALVPGTSQWI